MPYHPAKRTHLHRNASRARNPAQPSGHRFLTQLPQLIDVAKPRRLDRDTDCKIRRGTRPSAHRLRAKKRVVQQPRKIRKAFKASQIDAPRGDIQLLNPTEYVDSDRAQADHRLDYQAMQTTLGERVIANLLESRW